MLITTESELDSILLALKSAKYVVFDFETIPSSAYAKHKGASLHHKMLEIEGLSLRSESVNPAFIPFINTSISRLTLIEKLKELFSQESLFIAHNIQFDAKIADYFIGVRPKNKFCTLVGYWYIDENAKKDKVTLGSKLFGMETISYKEAKKQGEEVFLEYALRDVEFAWQLYNYEMEWFNAEEDRQILLDLVSTLEMDFCDVLIDITLRGISCDLEYLKQGEKILTDKALELEAQIYDKYGEFNLKSPMQLCEKIYGIKISRKDKKVTTTKLEGDYPKPTKFTKTGAPSTDDESLSKIDTDITRLIKEYRAVTKILDTYAVGFQKWIVDGRIYPSYNNSGCVAGDTLIPTDKGMLPIESLSELDFKVLNKDLEFEKPSRFFKFENQETITINTTLGVTFTGTLNHPIISNKYSFEDLKSNRSSCRSKEIFYHSEKWKTLGEITTKDYVKVPLGYECFSEDYLELKTQVLKYRTNAKKIVFPVILNEELGELLGIYFADGSIHDGNGSFSIRISNKDKEVQNRVVELAKHLFQIDARPENTCVNIRSIHLKSFFLNELDIRRGVVNKVFPEKILSSPKSVIAAFIKGMTLDSSLIREDNKTYLKISVANLSAAKTLQQLLFSFGVVSSLRINQVNNNIVCIYNDEYNKFIEKIGVIQSSKVDVWEKKKKKSGYIISPDGKCLWLRVKSITYGIHDVFDFTVPITHSFLSGGLISHNTVSGRLSSDSPNTQNVSREPSYGWWLREALHATEGYKLIVADESQLEIRLIAHLSEDPYLIKAIKSGEDIHTSVGRMVLNKNDISLTERSYVKTLNFAVLYGLSTKALAENLGISWTKANKLKKRYFSTFPGVQEWIEKVRNKARKNGYLVTLIGRRRRLPDLLSSDDGIRGYAERQASNAQSQGGGSDILKVAMVNISRELKEKNLDAYILLQIHDELVLEAREEIAEEVAAIVKNHMEHPFNTELLVPLVVNPTICDKWSDGK